MRISLIKLCLFAALVTPHLHAAETTQLPIENFARLSDYLDISLSPDGKHYAARIREGDTVFAVFIRVSDLKQIGGLKPDPGGAVYSLNWANNERVVFQFGTRWPGQETWTGTGELLATNIDGRKSKLLAGMRAGAASSTGTHIKTATNDRASHFFLHALPDDPKHVLIIEHPWTLEGNIWYATGERKPIVSKLNIFTGNKKDRETLPYPGATPIPDGKGQIRFLSWQTKDGKTHAAFRPTVASDWQEISKLTDIPASSLEVLTVNDAGTTAYLMGIRNSDSMQSIFAFDLASNKVQPVFEHRLSIDRWITDSEGDIVIAATYPGQVSYHYSNTKPDSSFIKYHTLLSKAFQGQEVDISSYDDTEDKLITHVSSSTNPGEYYTFDTKTNQAGFIWANSSWIDPRLMARKEPISLTTRDDLTIHGYLTRPVGAGSKLPLVIIPHGGPHGYRDLPDFDPEVQLLANRGYAVLQINFRGSQGYGEEFKRTGYQQWGKSMINDIIDATEWTIKQGYADADRVCIYGASYGGYAALMSAVRAPELFQCTVGYVGVYDLEAMSSKGDIPSLFGGIEYVRRVVGMDPTDLREQSPIHHADKIRAAIMLIHGDEDLRVPGYHAKELRKALEKAQKDFEWLYFDDVRHGARSAENRIEIYTKLVEFLDQHIGSAKPKRTK